MRGRVRQKGGMRAGRRGRLAPPQWRRLVVAGMLLATSIEAISAGRAAVGDGSDERPGPTSHVEEDPWSGSSPGFSAHSRTILQALDAAGLPTFLVPGTDGRVMPGRPGGSGLEGAPKTSAVFDWEVPGCAMLLPVVKGESGTRVTGNVVNPPYQGTIEWTMGGGEVAISGIVELGFRDACPEGAREFPGLLNSTKLLSNNKKGFLEHPTFGGTIHGTGGDVNFEIKNWKMSVLSSSPFRVAGDQFGLAVSLALHETSLVIHNGTEEKSWDISRLRATAVGSGRALEQDGKMLMTIPNLPYKFDTDQLSQRERPPVRLILEFVTNITARVDLPLGPSVKPSGRPAPQGGNGITAADQEGVSGVEIMAQNFSEGPVLMLSERELTLAATTMAVPVFALAVLGMVLVLMTFWHLPTLRACLTPLDKKLLRQVTDAMERGMTMGSMGGGRMAGTTDIGSGGILWTGGGPPVSARTTSFDMGRSTVGMDAGRWTGVGGASSRGSLTFQGVTCSVPVRRRGVPGPKSRWAEFEEAATLPRRPLEHKVILQPCSGNLRGGELTGVLGPAGSGKRALLRILAGDLRDMDSGALVQGSVLTQGAGNQSLKANVGLVTGQSEALKSMTVAEAMVYTALLKSKSGTELTLIKQRILMASEELQLTPLMSCFVNGGRLDGAERRRLMIACELQLDPDILLVEEPTAGLSATDATNVIKALRQVSRFGRAVLVSLSQLSNDLFTSLDNAMLLGRGFMVFNGPTTDAHGFFNQADCPAPVGGAFPQHAMKALSRPGTLKKLIEVAGKEGGPLEGVALMPALSIKVIDKSAQHGKVGRDTTSKLTTNDEHAFTSVVPDTVATGNHDQAKHASAVAEGSTSEWTGACGRDALAQPAGFQASQRPADVVEESDMSYTKYDAVDDCAHRRCISNASSSSTPFAQFEWNNGLAWQASQEGDKSPSSSSNPGADFSYADENRNDCRREVRLSSALEMHHPRQPALDRWDSSAELLSKSPVPPPSRSPSLALRASRFEELPVVTLSRTKLDDVPKMQSQRSPFIKHRGESLTPQLPLDGSSPSATTHSVDDDPFRVQLDCQTSGDLIELVDVESRKKSPLPAPTGAKPSQGGGKMGADATFARKPNRKTLQRGNSLDPGSGLQPSSPLKIGQGAFGRPPINPRGPFSQKTATAGGPSSLTLLPRGEASELAAPLHRSDTAMPMLGGKSSKALDSGARNDRYLKEPPVRQRLTLEAALLFWRGLNHMYRELTMLTAHALAALGFGALLGLIFFNLDDIDTEELRSHSTALFLAMSTLSMSAVASVCGLNAERALAVHEVRSGHYRTVNYVLVHAILSFLILGFIPVSIFSGVFLSMAELDTWSGFSWETAMHLILTVGGLTTFWGTMAGMINMALSCTARRGVKILMVVAIVLYGPLVSGFLVHKDNIPSGLASIHYVSPFSVTFEALMIGEFSSVHVDTGRQVTVEASEGSVTTLEEDTFRAMGLDEDNLALDSALAVLFYAFVVTLTVVGTWARSKRPHTLSAGKICCC